MKEEVEVDDGRIGLRIGGEGVVDYMTLYGFDPRVRVGAGARAGGAAGPPLVLVLGSSMSDLRYMFSIDPDPFSART